PGGASGHSASARTPAGTQRPWLPASRASSMRCRSPARCTGPVSPVISNLPMTQMVGVPMMNAPVPLHVWMAAPCHVDLIDCPHLRGYVNGLLARASIPEVRAASAGRQLEDPRSAPCGHHLRAGHGHLVQLLVPVGHLVGPAVLVQVAHPERLPGGARGGGAQVV